MKLKDIDHTLPPRVVQKTAWELIQRHGPFPLAFLIEESTTGNRLYFARHLPSSDWAPTSAVVKLIQGIHENYPEVARKLIRNRIYSTSKATEMCWGMVKVAAKRLSPNITPIDMQATDSPIDISALLENAVEINFISPLSSLLLPEKIWCQNTSEAWPPRSPDGFIRLASWMSSQIQRNESRFASDRPVAALLVSSEGSILSWAVNTSAKNRTLHAEVNLIQSFYRDSGKPIPRGANLYTSMKPCKMCAAMIWHSCEDIKSLKVYFLEDDPGPNARYTVLNPGTHERKRAARTPEELTMEIEQQLVPGKTPGAMNH